MPSHLTPPPPVAQTPSTPHQHLLPHFSHLIRLPNQTGTLLLLLPTCWALVLATDGSPPFSLIVIFSLGAFVMRSAGVIMNDLADMKFDRRVARTKTRPLASGALLPSQALWLLGILLSTAVLLLWFLPPFVQWLSPMALGLALLYPFTKRFFHLPQFFLGLAFGWGVIMAWASCQQNLAFPAWSLFGATVCWALAYDTIYALQDQEDDRRIGVKSSALFFGPTVWIAVGGFELLMLGFLGMAGWWVGLNLTFYGFLLGIAGLFAHQVLTLRNSITPARAFSMFQQHVGIGIVVLVGLWAGTF